MGKKGDNAKKKVVVIGSGLGGAASAALLAKSGFDVTLLESNDFQGGRCATLERKGFQYDFGVHMFSRGDSGPHGQVNRELGGNLRWVKKDPPCHVMGKMEFDFPLDIKPLKRQIYLARQLKIGPANLPGVFFLFRSLLNPRSVEQYDNITLRDYVSRFTSDDNVHLFLNCLCQLYFAMSYKESSAGEFIWCFTRMFNNASFGYPQGGGSAIPGSFLDVFKDSGGSLLYGQPVHSIVVKNGAAVGVRTAKKFYPADIVISNAGINRTIDMAGKKNFPGSYTEKAQSYVYSNAYITIKYALSRPVIPYPVVFYMPDMPGHSVFDYIRDRTVPDDPYIFLPVPSNQDPGLAPRGQQLVIAGTAAPSGASKKLCEAIIDRVDRRVRALFPALEKAIIWKITSVSEDTSRLTHQGNGACIGLGQVPGQVGEHRPSLETPLKNLWLVGADAGSRGIGTEMASGSALNLAAVIRERY
ncbi:MAG: NAD(P)/FAD-dependent oxidoreductase [Spirochaetes bacterium]|nr:NAD(P)/FAD-dependent oxidoreductase [Spirochaetota bacterium]